MTTKQAKADNKQAKQVHTQQPLGFLGGLSAVDFMQQHWQKQMLVVQGACAELAPLSTSVREALDLELADLLNLIQQEDVDSLLEWFEEQEWQSMEGPFEDDIAAHFDGLADQQIEACTLFVHGVNLHHQGVADLARLFNFIPTARFDEVAVSYASAGAYIAPNLETIIGADDVNGSRTKGLSVDGANPVNGINLVNEDAHTTNTVRASTDNRNAALSTQSKDLFILQLQGQRAYRVGHIEQTSADQISAEQTSADQTLAEQSALEHHPDSLNSGPRFTEPCFAIEHEIITRAGDLLYLPAHQAYDSVVMSEDSISMVVSFSSLSLAELARGLLEVALDQVSAQAGIDSGLYSNPPLTSVVPTHFKQNIAYSDAQQEATSTPAAIPDLLLQKALEAVQSIQFNKQLAARFIGSYLSEPDTTAEFPMPEQELDWPDFNPNGEFVLNLKSRILYYADELYINGEAIAINHAVLQELANHGRLAVVQALTAPQEVQDLLLQWLDDAWILYRE